MIPSGTSIPPEPLLPGGGRAAARRVGQDVPDDGLRRVVDAQHPERVGPNAGSPSIAISPGGGAGSAAVSSPIAVVRAYAVHLVTASGVAFAFLATAETLKATPDPLWVFAWLAGAVVVDSIDGPMARAAKVKVLAPRIDGRTIDDIVDYLTFTFVPLLLVWRMDWLPEPGGLWVSIAMMASLLGFANVGAKEDDAGFFLGFPSYWNVFAFYAGIWATAWGRIPGLVVLLFLAVLTVVPVRFVYPNRTRKPWRVPLTIGALLWVACAFAVLREYPSPPPWLHALSLVYPAFYIGLSIVLDRADRRAARTAR